MTTATYPDLAALRREQGLSLGEIADATKIRTHYLDAIEHGRFEKLPGGVYNRSYIRQYARAIHYDEAQLLACYASAGGGPESEAAMLPLLAELGKTREERQSRPAD